MTAFARITLLSLVLGLSACAVHRPPPGPTGPTIPPSGPSTQPSTKPSGPVTPAPKPVPTKSPTFAPPPGAASHWDGKMQEMLPKAQDKDGSWSGHHCITGRTFCTLPLNLL